VRYRRARGARLPEWDSWSPSYHRDNTAGAETTETEVQNQRGGNHLGCGDTAGDETTKETTKGDTVIAETTRAQNLHE
jgi:hypothetical protein